MPRSPRSWDRTDSLVVLASYAERPPHALVPPLRERERVASVLRQPVEEVTRRMWMFAGLDPENPSEGTEAGERERRLWAEYADDRLRLMLDTDAALEGRRRVPRHFR